jgi:hypothetical protein
VDAVLTASRSMVAVATRSLGAAAEETTIARRRAPIAGILARLPMPAQQASSVRDSAGELR